MDQGGKKSKKMESIGNRIHSFSSKHSQTRCRTGYATNARNLTFVWEKNEFSWTHEESGEVRFLLALSYNGRSRGYVGQH